MFGFLEVAYTPIEYVEQPLVNSFSQFLLRWGIGGAGG